MSWDVREAEVTSQPEQSRLTVERLPETANADPQLSRRGGYVSSTFILDAGPHSYRVTVEQGEVRSVDPGPFVMFRSG